MNSELRRRLEDGLDEIAPRLAGRILEQPLQPVASEAELFGEEQNDAAVYRMPPRRKRVSARLCRAVVGLAAAFVMFFCLREVRESSIIEGQIIVDVNPSVALSVNKMGRVNKVEALNEDGISIVDGLSKKRGPVGAVLESLFASLENQNYLKSDKSGVLVSYCYKQESVAVETHIQSAIETISGSRQNCTIYTQAFEQEVEEEEKAKSAGVSVGKYYFVNRIKEDAVLSEEVSYDKTIEEIARMIDDQGVQVAGIAVYSGGVSPTSLAENKDPNGGNTDDPLQITQKEEDSEGLPSGAGDSAGDTQSTEDDPQSTERPGVSTQRPGDDRPHIEYPDQSGTEGPKLGTENPTPGTEEPGTENPTPGTEEPGTEEPGTENPTPGTEEPGTENLTPGTEEPAPTEPDVSSLVLSWVKAEPGIDRKVYITWESLELATAYEVYYRREGSKSFERIGERVTGSACVVAGLMPERGYEFRIVPYLLVDGKKYFGEAHISNMVRIIPEYQPSEDDGPEDGTESTESTEEGNEGTESTEEGTEGSEPAEEGTQPSGLPEHTEDEAQYPEHTEDGTESVWS